MKLMHSAIDTKVEVLNAFVKKQSDLDMDELRQWRNKANGLSAPAATVPLIPVQIPIPTVPAK